ncbi:HpcH/HpaI aldolase family protein [Sphaerisporangium corydalis]|uniref:HpcH/HpaI aldolase/citrate lyase family protein n=1 Tax=Sphaerisporangium corydalis TaxID=1441875 RepID=A0ABV9EDX9_9ACTN|nr:aldolase/citrate lyase family protein [Sphaerisporangium corydalis]
MTSFATRLRARDRIVGFWQVTDNAVAAEHLAGLGYDYLCFDLQHGLIGYAGFLAGVTAVDAAGGVSLARVGANDPAPIGRALDAGAQGVIVPLVDSAAEAAAAARACRYPPAGGRSFGPMRAGLRIGPDPRAADEAVACVVMIETRGALDDIDAICATPGVDGVYIGPADLSLALGAPRPGAVEDLPEFEEALTRIAGAAESAGIAAGIHCFTGAEAARHLAGGFTFTSVSSDLSHLESAARASLQAARS